MVPRPPSRFPWTLKCGRHLICLNYPPEPSGNAPYSGALAEGLAERGVGVHVVTGLPHYPQWRIYDGLRKGRHREQERCPVTRRRHPVPAKPQIDQPTWDGAGFRLRALIRNWHKPDVVVLLSPALFSSMLVAFRAAFSRRPLVVWVQDFYSLVVAEAGQAGALQSRSWPRPKRGLFSRARARGRHPRTIQALSW